MTREEEIKKAAFEYADKELIGIIDFKKETAFIKGAKWADSHPHWISVDEELPKEHEWILGYSLKREYVDVYNFDSNGLIEAHGITHWMHLSPPPIIISSKEGGKK